MNIHKNARLTPYSRAEAARRVAERAGLISCQSGVARSIPLLGEPEALPILRSSEIQSVKSMPVELRILPLNEARIFVRGKFFSTVSPAFIARRKLSESHDHSQAKTIYKHIGPPDRSGSPMPGALNAGLGS
jgi:hypothetical protein